MDIVSKCVQVPIPTSLFDTVSAPVEQWTSNSEAKEAIMSNLPSKCQALTKKGAPCKNGIKSGATIPHTRFLNDVDVPHSHYLCGPHFDQHQKTKDVSINPAFCPAIESMTKAEQPTLNLPNTDGLTAIQKARIAMKAPSNPTMDEAKEILMSTNKPKVVVFGERYGLNIPNVRTHLIGKLDVEAQTYPNDGLYSRISEAIGDFDVLCGGAIGADLEGAASATIVGIDYYLYLPHVDYHSHYLAQLVKGKPQHIDDERWNRVLEKAASEPKYSFDASKKFHYTMNFKRNVDMASAGDWFVCISGLVPSEQMKLDGGGTKHMLETLKAKGVKRVYHIQRNTGEGKWYSL